ncbi:MAG: RdgB/HAM1 family non-canonical purine NTP pyrophosphatase [Chthoniobacterales bacterium]
MTRLLIATRNPHKTREFAQMLGADFVLEDLLAHPEIAEVPEVGTTFTENAHLKATEVSRQVDGLVLADDSGLEVDSLGGGPGVYSARYAGERATDAENRHKLLSELAPLDADSPRRARFRCVLVLVRAGDVLAMLEGTVEGCILEEERGQMGFGYDPLFQPVGFDRTFAELSAEEKNSISHRAVAVSKLRDFLRAMT